MESTVSCNLAPRRFDRRTGDRHVAGTSTARLGQTRCDGDSQRGLLHLEQGRYGPIYPRTPACHGFTLIAKIKPGTEADDPRLREDDRGDDRRESARAGTAAAALPALGALRHRAGQVLHVPGHLRYRFRQVHRGRGSAVQGDRRHHDLREARRLPGRTGRRTRRHSSSSSASISAQASSSTGSTHM